MSQKTLHNLIIRKGFIALGPSTSPSGDFFLSRKFSFENMLSETVEKDLFVIDPRTERVYVERDDRGRYLKKQSLKWDHVSFICCLYDFFVHAINKKIKYVDDIEFNKDKYLESVLYYFTESFIIFNKDTVNAIDQYKYRVKYIRFLIEKELGKDMKYFQNMEPSQSLRWDFFSFMLSLHKILNVFLRKKNWPAWKVFRVKDNLLSMLSENDSNEVDPRFKRELGIYSIHCPDDRTREEMRWQKNHLLRYLFGIENGHALRSMVHDESKDLSFFFDQVKDELVDFELWKEAPRDPSLGDDFYL